jgi:hypothetical protein
MKQPDHSTGTDTNFGWWIDKPERAVRQSQQSIRKADYNPPSAGIWWKAMLIVALMFAFGWSLKSLAGW